MKHLDYIEYNPVTGLLKWKGRPREDFSSSRSFHHFMNTLAGKEAGSRDFKKSGKPARIRVDYSGRSYPAHRIAFALMGVEVPDGMVIDHVNGDPFDNRWCNLRLATPKENSRNQGVRSNNRSGHTGVYQCKKTGAWMASIRVDRRLMHLGTFHCKGLALVARAKASIRHFKQFSPLNPNQ